MPPARRAPPPPACAFAGRAQVRSAVRPDSDHHGPAGPDRSGPVAGGAPPLPLPGRLRPITLPKYSAKYRPSTLLPKCRMTWHAFSPGARARAVAGDSDPAAWNDDVFLFFAGATGPVQRAGAAAGNQSPDRVPIGSRPPAFPRSPRTPRSMSAPCLLCVRSMSAPCLLCVRSMSALCPLYSRSVSAPKEFAARTSSAPVIV